MRWTIAVWPSRSSPSQRGGSGEREVDLHLGAAVAEAAFASSSWPSSRPAVELGRRDVRDHRARGRDLLAAGEPHAGRLAVADEHALDVAPGLAGAAVILDQPHERIDEPRAAAARDRHAALLHRDRDHLGHEARRRRVGPEAGVQHPRREQRRARRSEAKVCVSQSRLETSTLPVNSTAPWRPSRRYAFSPRPSPSRDHSSVPSTPKARSAFGKNDSTRARATPSPELGGVRLGRAQQEGRLAVREERRGRAVGVQVLEPARARARRRAARAPRRRPRADARR